MTRVTTALLLAGITGYAATTLSISYYRHDQYGPERIFAGRTYLYEIHTSWGFDATCSAADNTCYSPDYTPGANDTFNPDPFITPPGGLQNIQLGFQDGRPQYKAVNIGTNGNAAGHWNIMTCKNYSGGTCTNNYNAANGGLDPGIVTITSTATTHFYITSAATIPPDNAFFHTDFGWPSGTTIQWYNSTSVSYSAQASKRTYAAGNIWSMAYGFLTAVEVTIPAATTPGTIHAGWELCKDAGFTTCSQVAWDIQVEAPPTMELTPPASIPALPSSYATSRQCVDASNFSPYPSTDCSFIHLMTGPNAGGVSARGLEATTQWYCIASNPDLGLELHTPAQWIDLISSPNNQTSNYTYQGGIGFFYDGSRFWYALARWFNQPQWENCARAMDSRYAQRGPGVPGVPSDGLTFIGSSSLNASTWGKTVGAYRNASNGNAYTSVHAVATWWNNQPIGFVNGMGRFNQGKYSSSWVPNQYSAEMRNELFNHVWTMNGWVRPAGAMSTNSGALWGPGLNAWGGYVVGDGRNNGYPFLLLTAYWQTGEPETQTTGAVNARVTSLTRFGLNMRNEVVSMLSEILMWAQPAGTSASTNVNWGPIGAQPFQIFSSTVDGVVRYWERTHDPAIAKALKYLFDYMAPQYDFTTHAFPGSSAPKGPYCTGAIVDLTPTEKWYASTGSGAIANCTTPYYQTLGAMYGWAYAWFWRNWGGVATGPLGGTGDDYRTIADDNFNYSFAYFSGNERDCAKNMYENGRHWFDYLRYRLGY